MNSISNLQPSHKDSCEPSRHLIATSLNVSLLKGNLEDYLLFCQKGIISRECQGQSWHSIVFSCGNDLDHLYFINADLDRLIKLGGAGVALSDTPFNIKKVIWKKLVEVVFQSLTVEALHSCLEWYLILTRYGILDPLKYDRKVLAYILDSPERKRLCQTIFDSYESVSLVKVRGVYKLFDEVHLLNMLNEFYGNREALLLSKDKLSLRDVTWQRDISSRLYLFLKNKILHN